MASTPPPPTPPVPWIVLTTGARAVAVELMDLTVPLISAAFVLMLDTVLSTFLTASFTEPTSGDSGLAAARMASAF